MGDDEVDVLRAQSRTFEELIDGLVEAEDPELEDFLPVHLEVEFLDLGPIDLQWIRVPSAAPRSEEHTSELQSLAYLVCRLLLEKKKKKRLEKCVVRIDYY